MTRNTTHRSGIEVAHAIGQEQVKTLETTIDEITSAITENERKARVRVDNDIFAATYMPFFAGEETKYDVNAARWIALAGGPCHYVDIINKSGDVVAVVPPVMNFRTVRDMNAPGEVDFNRVLTEALTRGRQAAPLADAYIYQVASLFKVRNDETTDEERRIRMEWRDLFTYFGYGHMFSDSPDAVKTVSVADAGDEWVLD